MNPSGVSGWKGKIADAWDRIPVKGPMALLVGCLGIVLAAGHGGLVKGNCDKDPLQHVYRPQRLQVVQKCAEVTGTVVAWRHEHDGDYHVSMVMDGSGWVNDMNKRRQKGYTVVEFVPLMPVPKFKHGQRLRMIGTKVLDKQHGGWIELHPVFSFEELNVLGTDTTNHPNLALPTEEEDADN